jgi:hypothetical protein
MKKILLFLVSVLLVTGCAQNIEFTEPFKEEIPNSRGRTRSLEGAIYNEVIDAWMIPQKDPYSLANFQQAYDRLMLGKSTQTLTRAQVDKFTSAQQLKPTHYALKIYPKTEEEQWRIEMMKDVQVAHIPFCYSRLTQQEAEKVAQTKSIGNVFTEKSPYTVIHDNADVPNLLGVTDGGLRGRVTIQLPILYTVWPVDKPLPNNLEYVVDYEIFLPDAADNQPLDAEILQLIEFEAVSAALGDLVSTTTSVPATRAQEPGVLDGRILTYDSTLRANVPMSNLTVLAQIGSRIILTKTDSNGYFRLKYSSGPLLFLNYSGALTLGYREMGKWIIVADENTSITYSVTIDAIFSSGELLEIVLPIGNRQENVIHRAMNYFYNVQTDFPTEGEMKVIAVDDTTSVVADFTSGEMAMYNSGNADADVLGWVLRQIGLFIIHNNNYSGFWSDGFFTTSAMSYVDWYLGNKYYESVGWVKPPYTSMNGSWVAWPEIVVGEHNQSWRKTFLRSDTRHPHSPIFIDLTDDWNQRDYFHVGTELPDDNINSMPAYLVWDIISTWSNWAQCKVKLQNYVGTYYSTDQLNSWIADFDYWFERNT